MIVNSHYWITRASFPHHGNENALGVVFKDLETDSIKDVTEDCRAVRITTNCERKLKSLIKYQNIEAIDLRHSDVTVDALKELQHFPSLKALNLSENTINNEWLEVISKLVHLEEFETPSIRTGYARDNLDITPFSELKNLRILYTTSMSDEYIKILSTFECLKELKIKSVKDSFSDEGLEALSTITSLEALWIINSGKTTPEGYKNLSRLASLKTFVIAGRTSCLEGEEMIFPFTDDSLYALKDLPLSFLFLNNCRITNKSLPVLKNFTSLDTIEIEDCRFMSCGDINGIKMLDDCIQSIENRSKQTGDEDQEIQDIHRIAVYEGDDKNLQWEIKTEHDTLIIKYSIKDRITTLSTAYPDQEYCLNAALNKINGKFSLYNEKESIFNEDDNDDLLAEAVEKTAVNTIFSNIRKDPAQTIKSCKDILLNVKDRIAVMTAMKEAAYHILEDLNEHEDNVKLYDDISGTDSFIGTCDYLEKSIISSIIIELNIAREAGTQSPFAVEYLEKRNYGAEEFSSPLWLDDPHNPVHRKLVDIVDKT